MENKEPDNESLQREWHIVYTNPRAEKKVKTYLDRYEIINYLPLLNIKSKWSDRWKMVEKPLFTSYLFVRISYWEEKNKVLMLPGIHHIVFYKGVPATVTQEDLDLVDLFVQNYAETLKVQKHESLQAGKKLEIKHGKFKGKIVEVLEQKNKFYVVVNLPMMGQTVRAEIQIEDLGLEELKV
ncbi:UpxY family transcription antiterminator [Leptospira sp. GIMC2001]|uniref:UpxY family transcription antiterminator n=1 Tax=Leptospira sp. GIMC2001 TaxID=1513297 RepID=UPI00234AB606|nr:UpxY family transcription antiterminator [Leptospira sp. GIMC2001]WCL49403.1 UpxY family transcription antiterminator [Leptospira sp. GIMC2001]